MVIKIVGKNSSNRIKLIKNLNKALETIDNFDIKIELLEEEKDIAKYNITNAPGFIVNDKVVSQGKVLTEKEIKKFIKILL